MSRTSLRSNTDLPPPSDRRVPHPNRGDSWNALADIEVFVFAVEAELEAMDRERVGVHRRGAYYAFVSEDGHPVSLPATRPVPVYKVVVEDGSVYVSIETADE